MNVGERILLRRKTLGLTQIDVAKVLNVDAKTFREIEKGRSMPDSGEICTLAAFLRTTAAYLLGETDNPNPAGVAPMAAASINNNNSNTGDNTVNVNTPSPSKASRPVRWWTQLLQNAYDTADDGDQQQIFDALNATRQATTILERAVQETTPA